MSALRWRPAGRPPAPHETVVVQWRDGSQIRVAEGRTDGLYWYLASGRVVEVIEWSYVPVEVAG